MKNIIALIALMLLVSLSSSAMDIIRISGLASSPNVKDVSLDLIVRIYDASNDQIWNCDVEDVYFDNQGIFSFVINPAQLSYNPLYNLKLENQMNGLIIFEGRLDKVVSEQSQFGAYLNPSEIEQTGNFTFNSITIKSGDLELREAEANGTNKIILKAPESLSSDFNLIFPSNSGNSGQVLTTDGSGTLSWVNAGGGSYQTISNLSTDVITDGSSDTKYPSVKAIKTYVDNAVVTETPDATATIKGKIQLDGDLSGTANSPTVPGLANKVDKTTTVNGKALSGNISLVKADIGLTNIDNTSDASKPISTQTQTALDTKESLNNKSTNVASYATSDTKYPSVKATKTYVDNSIATGISDLQPLDADLTTISALSSADGNFIVGSTTGWIIESGATARESLGLGTLATQSGTFSGTSTGTNTGDISLGTANGLILSGQTLSLTTANGTSNGALSSVDWNIFNNKQTALGFTPENITNKVTSISNISTNTEYPSAKLVYDQLALKVTSNTPISNGTYSKITYDSKGLVTGGANLTDADIPNDITINFATNLTGGIGGSIPYQSSTSNTSFLNIGTQYYVLYSTGSLPKWSLLTNNNIDVNAEISVNKLANGTAGQILRTASDGTTVEWANNTSGIANLTATTSGGIVNFTYDGSTAISIAVDKSQSYVWSGVHTYYGNSPLVFDGASSDGNTTTFSFTEPTGNRIISFPDETGSIALTNNKLCDFANTTSAELANVITNETGSGFLVFGTAPTIANPIFTGTMTIPDHSLQTNDLPAGNDGQILRTDGTNVAWIDVADAMANFTATNSTLTFSGTYNGSVDRTVGLNLSNSNTWTSTQNFRTILPSANNTYDLGSSANVWANVYATAFIGALSGNATSATNSTNIGINNNTTLNSTVYPTWVSSNSGNLALQVTSSKLYYNPSSGMLTSTGFAGTLTGTASNASKVANSLSYGTGITSFDYDGSSAQTVSIDLSANLSWTGNESFSGNVVLGSDANDLITINGTLQGASPLVFEGGTADAFELTLNIATLNADQIITLPDATGTIALTSNKLSDFANTLSDELASVITNETGTGSLVFGTSPTIANPTFTGTVTIPNHVMQTNGLVAGSVGQILRTDGTNVEWSNIADAMADLTATNNTITFSGVYDGSTAQSIALNLGNSNTWTVTQNFRTILPSANNTYDLGSSANVWANVYATNFNGSLIGTATNSTNVGITNNTTSNTTVYPTWVTSNTGNLAVQVTSSKLYYNPSTGILTSTGFVGSLTGTASNASKVINGLSQGTGISSFSYDGSSVQTVGIDLTSNLSWTGNETFNGNVVLGSDATDLITINGTLQGASPLVFEGSTADAYETTLSITNPTSDQTITMPNATGTVALTNNKLSDFANTTSVELAGKITDETGTGYLVFSNSPTLITPTLGVATVTTINGFTLPSSNAAALGQILTSTGANKILQWSNSDSGWGLSGNSGTDAATNFIGTTDDKALVFKVNNQKSGELSSGTNTSFGYQTIISNTTGTKNTAIGYQSLYSNTEGNYNTANGYQALYNTTGGYGNTAVGYRALKLNDFGYYNTAIGYVALASNTYGFHNTATGYGALGSNTTGYYNTATGYEALGSNRTGQNNTAIGYQSLSHDNSTGSNTANGSHALHSNTYGTLNTAQGACALYANTTGDSNTAIGSWSGRFTSDGSTENKTSSNSVYIGAYTKASADGNNNEVVIGFDAIGSGSNSVQLGNSTISKLYCKGAYTATTTNQSNMYVASDGQIMRSTATAYDLLKLTPRSSAPSSPTEGTIYYNSTDHKIYFYNGSNWVAM